MKQNFSFGWKFILEKDCGVFPAFGFRKCGGATGPAALRYHDGLMREVDIPHDWGMELTPDLSANTGRGARPISPYLPLNLSPDGSSHIEAASVGWYRKHFSLAGIPSDKRIFLEFEGVFRDYTLFVNGIYIDRHTSGYTPAFFDITDQVNFEGDNVVALRVDASQPEGWWYEGAGIYRPVHLHIQNQVYIPHHTTFITPSANGEVQVSTALYNASDVEKIATLSCVLRDKEGKEVASSQKEVSIPSLEKAPCSFSFEKASILFGLPSGLKPSEGSNIRQIPVNDLSKFSIDMLKVPLAGSFITALFPLNPSSTTK